MKKILFVYYHKYPNLWKDGLWAALKLLEKDFNVVFFNLAEEKLPMFTDKYLKATSDILAPKLSPKQIEHYFLSAKSLPPVKLLPELKKKYRLAILSNNQKTWPKKFIAKSHLKQLRNIPFFNSAKIGLRKPHKEIYLFALNKLHATPQECIFIDDKPENIKPAKALGINTVLYRQDINELKRKLKKLGIRL